jgi:membrane-associated phospholipid phosphatase
MMRFVIAVSALLVMNSDAMSVSAQAPDSAGVVSPFVHDVKLGVGLTMHGLTAPARWGAKQWLFVPVSAAGLLALSHAADGGVQRMMLRNHSATADDVFAAIEPFGEVYAGAVLVGVYAGGVAFGRPELRRAAVEGAASGVVAAGVIVSAIKVVVGRARPRENQGVYSIHPFGSGRSFPSGHTAGAFSVGSVMAEESGKIWLQVPIYALASGVGVARMYHDAHFVSDVTAGALIGTLVGRMIVKTGRSRFGRISLRPAFMPGGEPGVAVVF